MNHVDSFRCLVQCNQEFDALISKNGHFAKFIELVAKVNKSKKTLDIYRLTDSEKKYFDKLNEVIQLKVQAGAYFDLDCIAWTLKDDGKRVEKLFKGPFETARKNIESLLKKYEDLKFVISVCQLSSPEKDEIEAHCKKLDQCKEHFDRQCSVGVCEERLKGCAIGCQQLCREKFELHEATKTWTQILNTQEKAHQKIRELEPFLSNDQKGRFSQLLQNLEMRMQQTRSLLVPLPRLPVDDAHFLKGRYDHEIAQLRKIQRNLSIPVKCEKIKALMKVHKARIQELRECGTLLNELLPPKNPYQRTFHELDQQLLEIQREIESSYLIIDKAF